MGEELHTITRTSSTTGTKLAIATLALAIAGGLAFAAIPAAKKYKKSRTTPITTVCKESDSGLDALVRGTTKGQSRTGRHIRATDRCATSGNLIEYYCSDNAVNVKNTVCDDGFSCTDGACVAEAPACSDTDGGENIFEQGTISGPFSPTDEGAYIVREHDFREFCVNSTTVAENFCSRSGFISGSDFACPVTHVCEAGACVEIREAGVNISLSPVSPHTITAPGFSVPFFHLNITNTGETDIELPELKMLFYADVATSTPLRAAPRDFAISAETATGEEVTNVPISPEDWYAVEGRTLLYTDWEAPISFIVAPGATERLTFKFSDTTDVTMPYFRAFYSHFVTDTSLDRTFSSLGTTFERGNYWNDTEISSSEYEFGGIPTGIPVVTFGWRL